MFFTPKYLKEAKLLHKGVTKFVDYKRDIISEEKHAKIQELKEEFESAIKQKDKGKIEELSKSLTRACERSVPDHKTSSLHENVEVIFVAVVIALGVRSYFVQPFKIPTGSMQPTLNGIVAYGPRAMDPEQRTSGEFKKPNIIKHAWDYAFAGRNWVDVRAPQDDTIIDIQQTTKARFFTFTHLKCQSGKTISIYAPMDHAMTQLGLAQSLGLRNTSHLRPGKGFPVKEGQILAQGYVDTGDQVLVNKFSYHFRKPKRGEVFVFKTKGITGIEQSPGFDPRFGSQHYIKRLAGTPNDHLQLKPNGEIYTSVRGPNDVADLYINGEIAQEKGFQRVMAREEGYRGYTVAQQGMRIHDIVLEEDEYFALGDNSPNSSDSRAWGVVKENNLVGPALFVYLPFAHHFGPIR